jgi:hypothetical protein
LTPAAFGVVPSLAYKSMSKTFGATGAPPPFGAAVIEAFTPALKLVLPALADRGRPRRLRRASSSCRSSRRRRSCRVGPASLLP